VSFRVGGGAGELHSSHMHFLGEVALAKSPRGVILPRPETMKCTLAAWKMIKLFRTHHKGESCVLHIHTHGTKDGWVHSCCEEEKKTATHFPFFLKSNPKIDGREEREESAAL
jgi:hypothetical protein